MNALHPHMRRALRLAERGQGKVSPNPLVGAVIVHGERIVGEGAHLQVGGAHAEVHALRQAGAAARDATLFVTLEPCSFQGRTPPCAPAVIAAGIRRVECAMLDPDPRVHGEGVRQLRAAGIDVNVGLGRKEAEEQNAAYIKHRLHGLPLVTLKLAQSLDGCIATATGDSRWITGERARRRVHRERSRVDAVMVGAGTVIADDPQLTVRHVRGRDPRPLVVDGHLRVPPGARLFTRSDVVVVTATDSPEERRSALSARGVEIWALPANEEGKVDLREVMSRAARAGITSVLLEGGSLLAAEAVAARIVDRVQIYIAPILVGEGLPSLGNLGSRRIDDAVHLDDVRVRRLDADLLYTATVRYACSPE